MYPAVLSRLSRDEGRSKTLDSIVDGLTGREKRKYDKNLGKCHGHVIVQEIATDRMKAYIKELREGEVPGWMSELPDRRTTAADPEKSEITAAMRDLVKQKNVLNRDVENHLDVMTGPALINLQEEQPDEKTAR